MYGSCHGRNACRSAIDSTINNDSCKSSSACYELQNTKIGYNSCNAREICKKCYPRSKIPINACNDEYGADTMYLGGDGFDHENPLFTCNYCLVCSMKK